ncbi:MAG: flavin reductase family protein [Oscillospiraceae bacterium]|nr:flavin reductase family protein [Oscillospiraceae bacterium]
MKKCIDTKLALYPSPVTIIGAMNGDKPTWTLVAHIGIIGHDRILVSLAQSHFINHIIKDNGKLSVNLVTKEMLPAADIAGSLTGASHDKSELFEYELGKNGTPVISAANLTLECTVVDIYNTSGFESFICTIDNTYAEESCLNDRGKPDYAKVKPVLFEFPNYQYLRTGDVIGKCLSFKEAK